MHPFSLRLPYTAKLDTTINPGQSLIVRGQPTGDRFDINLESGPTDTADIIFHMSCRLKEKEYVLNTKENGQWGKEERHKLHLAKGTPFAIRVRCHESKFELFVDGKEVAEYKYRTPLHSVNYVNVKGELTLNSVGWEGNYYSIPLRVGIPGNFGKGRKLFLTFIPEDDFSVNFMIGEDVAFHFNPRISKKAVVNNTKMNGVWGSEERPKEFPFEKKKSTDLLIVCEEQTFGVYINGQSYCTYTHRTDPSKISQLSIEGKMELQVVNFE